MNWKKYPENKPPDEERRYWIAYKFRNNPYIRYFIGDWTTGREGHHTLDGVEHLEYPE